MPAGDDVPALLVRLLADPGRPRVTWYGAGGERVELSGKTLLNWVSKTANLLVDELDVDEGGTVRIDLPAHWRTLTWLLATWAAGAEVVTHGDADVVVTTDPEAAASQVVAVALPALATSFGAPLPAGVHDGAVAVRTQPDYFAAVPHPGQAELLGHARQVAASAGVEPGDRVLAGADPALWLGVLALDGSLVLHHDPAGAPETLLAQEAVTRRA